MPEFSFLQLSDNREWSWDIFNLTSITSLNADRPELVGTITTEGEAPGAKAVPLVDQFGQLASEDWPGKVKNLAELKADLEEEKISEASYHPPQLDVFGGLPGSREKLGLKAAGSAAS